jgi:hypothetical protein
VGCGIYVQGESGPGVGCGMGHVAPLSDRFLVYYADK